MEKQGDWGRFSREKNDEMKTDLQQVQGVLVVPVVHYYPVDPDRVIMKYIHSANHIMELIH